MVDIIDEERKSKERKVAGMEEYQRIDGQFGVGKLTLGVCFVSKGDHLTNGDWFISWKCKKKEKWTMQTVGMSGRKYFT